MFMKIESAISEMNIHLHKNLKQTSMTKTMYKCGFICFNFFPRQMPASYNASNLTEPWPSWRNIKLVTSLTWERHHHPRPHQLPATILWYKASAAQGMGRSPQSSTTPAPLASSSCKTVDAAYKRLSWSGTRACQRPD